MCDLAGFGKFHTDEAAPRPSSTNITSGGRRWESPQSTVKLVDINEGLTPANEKRRNLLAPIAGKLRR
jgi:hypothetical protein